MPHTKRVAKFLGYALLFCGGCHFLATGSPIPLWRLETLKSPRKVREITDEFLILSNGQKVTLPKIQRVAAGQPLFHLATQEGIEIQADHQVYGLLWFDRYCGNDPYCWVRARVNLSELSGALEPTGIDPAALSAEHREFLRELSANNHESRQYSLQRGKINMSDRVLMSKIRRDFADANVVELSR